MNIKSGIVVIFLIRMKLWDVSLIVIWVMDNINPLFNIRIVNKKFTKKTCMKLKLQTEAMKI